MLESGIDFMHECEEPDEPLVYTEYVYEDDYPFPTADEYHYIPFDAEDDYTKIPKRKHVYKNDVIVYSNREQCYLTVRLSLDNIVVTKGRITFFVEDGTSFYIEDDAILHNICADGGESLPNKYNSFLGKKSILKHHFGNVIFLPDEYYGWHGKTDAYITEYITECIHDGVTTFIVTDEFVKGITHTH